MNNSITTLAALALLAGMTWTPVARASGQHPGGHDHAQGAIGNPGIEKQISRTVPVEMTDAMRFIPAAIAVRKGETIRFVVRNSGKLRHEFVLGTETALKEHAELMKKFPGMEHAESNMVSLAPGQTGDVIWQFTKAGRIIFACLQPGHYEAGMKGSVNVDASKAK